MPGPVLRPVACGSESLVQILEGLQFLNQWLGLWTLNDTVVDEKPFGCLCAGWAAGEASLQPPAGSWLGLHDHYF